MNLTDPRSRWPMTEQELWILLAWLSDGGIIALAFLLGYGLRSLSPHDLMPLDVYAGLAAVCILSFWGIQLGLGAYSACKRLSRFDEWVTILLGLGLAFGLVLAGVFFIRSISLSRLVVGYAGLLALAGLTLSRASLRSLMNWLRRQGVGVQQVLWIGHNSLLEDVLDRLQRSPQLGFHLVGQVTATAAPEQPHLPLACDLAHLLHYLQTHPEITEIWFAQPQLATAEILLSLQYLGHSTLQIRLLPDILAFLTVNFSLESLDGIPLLTLKDPPLRYWHNRLLKRALDLVGASVGLVLLSPLLLGVALCIRCTSPGPIFYWQERLSLGGRRFWIAKFRTMRVDAEADQQPGWTTPADPRRTSIGVFLRRFNLDELPQLWNVLKGEMSLVGPRPERPHFVQQFSQEIPKYLDRHLVKTGLTGWAQIHGLRGDTSIARRTQYDLYYVQNWSLLLDLRIIAKTLGRSLIGQIEGY